MKFLDEIGKALDAWAAMWGSDDPPCTLIVREMREKGLTIEEAARIAPEGYSYENEE